MSFKDFSLRPELHAALDKMGIHTPTPIQQQTLGHLLASEAVDFHGQAQTGTGKTLAFGLPLLHTIDIAKRDVQALIVAPTRELVVQITQALQGAGSLLPIKIVSIYGGVSITNQLKDLRRGAHIIVGTPGRLNDHLRRKSLSIANLRTIVLDEADIMLDMGFKEEVDEILQYAPKDRQIWLFSATVKSGIEDIKRKHMKSVVSAKVTSKIVTSDNTKQYYCTVTRKHRVHAIGRFIDQASEFYGFIFCPTKVLASEVASALTDMGYPASALHGDMNQTMRNAVIKKFKERAFSVLVATDVAARGIDVSGITHVINFSLPEDHESYVHRIGRTGRAGLSGVAITFLSRSEVSRFGRLAQKFKAAVEPINVPKAEDIAVQRLAQAQTYFTEKSNKTIAEKKYIAALSASLQEFSKETLISGLTNVLSDMFFATLDAQSDDFSDAATPGFNECKNEDAVQEVMLNLGTDDGMQEEDVIELIRSATTITEQDIKKIRVIKRRSFISLDDKQAGDVIHALRGKKVQGIALRPVRVYDERGGSGNFRERSRGRGRGGFGESRGGGERGGRRRPLRRRMRSA